MRPTLYPLRSLGDLLQRETVASMPQLMAALGTSTRRTVVRKLALIPHLTSYSHSRRYYALPQAACFDRHGLWSFQGVHFSSHGTLRATAEALVCSGHAGRFVPELDALLHVCCGDALRHLVHIERLSREKFDRRFLYCAPQAERRQQQILARRALAPNTAGPPPSDNLPPPAIATARQLFVDLLDERQRRLFAGLTSLERGHGGDRQAAALIGLHPSTVARGRRELLSGDVPRDRVRRPGGGRHRVEGKTVL